VGQHPIDPGIESAVGVLTAEPGLARVASLASAAGLPLRTFQDRFLHAVGLPAKAYARLLRLQNAIRRLDSEAQGLVAVALSAGFSDQPHATRELRRLTGLTPARLLNALRGERQSEATIALAAAFVRGGRQA
jgi:transcriptional regulator GlxA family with amidase domain